LIIFVLKNARHTSAYGLVNDLLLIHCQLWDGGLVMSGGFYVQAVTL